MEQLVECWKQTARRFWWLILLWTALAVVLAVLRRLPPWAVLLQLPLLAVFLSFEVVRRVLRFAFRVAGFSDLEGRHVRLSFPPELGTRLNLPAYVEEWDLAIEELAARFGPPPFRPVRVYLLANRDELALITNEDEAVAVAGSVGVVGLLAGMGPGPYAAEVMQHELAHLFAAKWGGSAPALKGEGLATCIQETIRGTPVDFHALAVLLAGKQFSLTELLEPKTFAADRSTHYKLAGSFTGYLIRGWGWETYRRWYGAATPRRFQAMFRSIFGLHLATAEQEWREALLARQPEFGPELTWEVHRHRAAFARAEDRLEDAVREVERLRLAGQANAVDLQLGAMWHMQLGNAAQAVSLFLEALVREPTPEGPRDRGWTWLTLGMLYQRLNDPEKAEWAFREALREEDGPWGEDSRVHDEARRRLGRFRGRRKTEEPAANAQEI